MEFLALFFMLYAFVFVLWLMTVAALFLFKVAIGTTGVIYYGSKKMMEMLLKILTRIAKILHLEGVFRGIQDKLPLIE